MEQIKNANELKPRTWTLKSPLVGYIRPSQVVRTARELAAAGTIVFPIDQQSLRKWMTGQYKAADEFPVLRADLRPLKESFLLPETADVLIAFWYDGRQRGETKREWRARQRGYLKVQKESKQRAKAAHTDEQVFCAVEGMGARGGNITSAWE